MYATVQEASAQVNVASVLSIEQRLLADELARLPRSRPGAANVDLAKMFGRLKAIPMQCNSVPRPVSPQVEQHQDIFVWCVIHFHPELNDHSADICYACHNLTFCICFALQALLSVKAIDVCPFGLGMMRATKAI